MLNTVIWWTGAAVLSAGAMLGAMAVFAGLITAAAALLAYAAPRAWGIPHDLYYMRQWYRAGRPKWYFEAGQPTRMKPTVTKREASP